MSKQPVDPVSLQADDLPPPYTSSAGDSVSFELSHSAAASASSSLFTSQLSNLRGLIHSQQAAHASARDEQDSQLLALLVPHVENFISSIATFNPIPVKAEAILLPEGAVGEEWALSDEQETGEGEIRQVIFVHRHDKLRSDAKGASQSSYGVSSSDQASHLWWTNENMAIRLAKHLQPERPAPERTVATPQPTLPPRQEKKPSRWKLFGRDQPSEPSPPSPRTTATSSRTRPEDVTMTTRAEEITFRRENEFGIWESKTGWGIIVQVRLPRA